MKKETYPLAMPSDLLGELREAAKETGLSVADTMRQSMKLGLPRLREQLSAMKLKPLTDEEARQAFAPDAEWDAFEAAMTNRPVPKPED